MVDDCSDCKFLEYDYQYSYDDILDSETISCIKGHELLLSMEIPEDCKDFVEVF